MVKYGDAFVLSMSIYLYVYVYLSLFLFFLYRKLIFLVINTAEMGSLSWLLYIHLFTWKQSTTNRPIKRPCNITVSLHATEYATRHCSGLVCTYTEPANQSFNTVWTASGKGNHLHVYAEYMFFDAQRSFAFLLCMKYLPLVSFSLSAVNTSYPIAAYMPQWSGSALLQVACSAPSRYLIVNRGVLGTNFNDIWIGILSFSIKKMHLKMSSAKMTTILSRGRCVKAVVVP